MSGNGYDIVVRDGIASSIAPNMAKIGASAQQAGNQFNQFNTQLNQFNTTINNTSNTINQFNTTINNTNVNNLKQRIQAATSSLNQLRSALSSVASVAGISLSIRGIGNAADEYVHLQDVIATTAPKQQKVNDVMGQLFDIANRNYVSIQHVTESYSNLSRNMSQLGYSTQDTLKVLNTITAYQSAYSEAAGHSTRAIQDLTRGMAQGALTGRELGQIAKEFPQIATQLSKNLGVPIAQFKDLQKQGGITGRELVKAIEQVGQSADLLAAQRVPTLANAFTVLHNSFVQVVGQFNDSTGIFSNIARGIIDIATNANILLPVIAGLGSAIALAFGGPAIAAIAAFIAPFAGLAGAVAGLAALTVHIVQLKAEADGLPASFLTLGDIASGAFDVLRASVQSVMPAVQTVASAISEFASISLPIIVSFANGFIGAIDLALTTIKAAISDFPTTWRIVFDEIELIIVQSILSIEKAISDMASYVVDHVKNIPAEIAAGAKSAAGFLFQTIPTPVQDRTASSSGGLAGYASALQGSIDDLKKASPVIGTLYDDLAKRQKAGYLGQFGDILTRQSESEARARLANGRTGLGGGGAGPVGTPTNEQAQKFGEQFAKVLAKLDDTNRRMLENPQQRNIDKQVDQIREQFIGRGTPLNDNQLATVRQKITANVQLQDTEKALDAIWNSHVQPINAYKGALQAANLALKDGYVTQGDYNAILKQAAEAYQAAVNPTAAYTLQIQRQIAVLQQVGDAGKVAAAVQQQVLAAQRQGKSVDVGQIAKDAQSLIDAQRSYSANQGIWDQTLGKLKEIGAQIDANNAAIAKGYLSKDQAQTNNVKLAGSAANVNLASGNGSLNDIGISAATQALGNFQNLSVSTAQILGSTFDQLTNGVGKAFEAALSGGQKLDQTIKQIGESILSSIVSSITKAIAQWALLQAMQAAGIGTGAATGGAGGSSGLGGSGVSVSQIGSFVGMIGSLFAEGGYTGSGGVTEPAGIVHGQEFVMNAAATRRIGTANLQKLQNGAPLQSAQPMQMAAPVVNTSVNVTPNIINVTDPNEALHAIGTNDGKNAILNVVQKNPNAFKNAMGVR